MNGAKYYVIFRPHPAPNVVYVRTVPDIYNTQTFQYTFSIFSFYQRFTVSNFRNLNDDSNENWEKNLTSTSDQKKTEKCDLKRKKNQARQNNLITVLPNSYSSNLVRCPIFAVSMVSLW